MLAERPGQAGAHGATKLQALLPSLLGLAPSGGAQHSQEGPQDMGSCMAGCVKDKQGYGAARGRGTSRILYFVHTVLSACGSCPTTPGAPRSCGVAVQWGSSAMGQQAHTVTPQLGRGAEEVGSSPQGAWGSGLATTQIPPSPSSGSPFPSYPPTPWAPCQLGRWDAGPAVGQGKGSDHNPQAVPTPRDPSSSLRPSCPLG